MRATLSTTEELRDQRGKRIRITFHDGESHTGQLEGATAEMIYFAGEGGGVIRTEIQSIELAPLVCSVCGRETNRLFEDMCADDYRKAAQRRPTPQEPCEICGDPGIRAPGDNRFLCVTHHADAGNKLRLTPGTSAVIATCATEDVESPNHDWRQVRGARFRCVRCLTAEKWDPALLKDLQSERPLEDG